MLTADQDDQIATAAAAPPPEPRPGITIERVEQCRCNGCESVIPLCNIRRTVDKEGFGPTTCVHEAYCDHCKIIYRTEMVLRDGQWIATGMEIIDNQRARDRFLREMATRRREVYLPRKPRERAFASRIPGATDDPGDNGKDFDADFKGLSGGNHDHLDEA